MKAECVAAGEERCINLYWDSVRFRELASVRTLSSSSFLRSSIWVEHLLRTLRGEHCTPS